MNEDLKCAVETLKNGGIILYPTDTIWGIGCDANNPEAVDRIYRLKKRPDRKSMLVLLGNENQLEQYIREIPEIVWQLLKVAENPITIVYPGAKNLAPNLIAENESIGIRIPKDDFCLELLHRFRRPVVSTSANVSGQPSPSFYNEISKEIKDGVDYIVKWRQNDNKKLLPSSILEVGPGGEIRIIRS